MPPALERLICGVAERMPVDVYLPDAARRRQTRRSPRCRLRLVGAWRRRARRARLGGAHETALARVRVATVHAAGGTRRSQPDGTLRLVSAPDPSREVRAAARACLEWAREGVPFWEMAVAYRHGEAYRPLVEAVFVEAGSRVYLHEGSPLAERPLGRQTLGAAGAVRQ